MNSEFSTGIVVATCHEPALPCAPSICLGRCFSKERHLELALWGLLKKFKIPSKCSLEGPRQRYPVTHFATFLLASLVAAVSAHRWLASFFPTTSRCAQACVKRRFCPWLLSKGYNSSSFDANHGTWQNLPLVWPPAGAFWSRSVGGH